MTNPSEHLEILLQELEDTFKKPISEVVSDFEEAIQLALLTGQSDRAESLMNAYSTYFEDPIPYPVKFFCVFEHGVMLSRSDEIEAAEQQFKICEEIAEFNDDEHSAARASLAQGIVCIEVGKYQKALPLVEKAVEELRKTSGTSYARALNWLGIASSSIELYQRAWAAYSEALEINEELSLVRDQGYVLGNMGLLCEQMGLYKQAEECYRRSMKLQKEACNNYGLADSMSNLGSILLKKKHLYREAETLLADAAKMHIENNSFSKGGIVLVGQAVALVHLGENKKAEELLEVAHEYIFSRESWYEQLEYCEERAELFFQSGNLEEAEKLVLKGMEIEKIHHPESTTSGLASIYSRILCEKGDFKEAFLQQQVAIAQERKLDSLKSSAMEDVINSLHETARAKKALLDAEEEAQILEEKNVSLRVSEERFRSLVSNMTNIGVIAVDSEGIVTFWNDTCTKLYGYRSREACGRKLSDLIIPEHLREWFETFVHSGITNNEFEVNLKDLNGRLKSVRISLVPIKQNETFIIQVDLTSQRNAENQKSLIEAQMRRTQKLEALGTLAGGIAHDFNNLLQGILGNAALLCDTLGKGSADLLKAERIKSAAESSAELCIQMLDYAGVKPVSHEPLDLNQTIGDISVLLETSLDKDVQLLMDLSNRVPTAIGDKSQIRQVIMNLVLNGAEAINGSGEVELSTDYVFRKREFFADNLLEESPDDGDFLLLKVRDTGNGIEPENLTRIFDPFFSTKKTGRGLGLAAVLGIIRGHSGAILVNSEIGEGTEFSVYLPPAPEENTVEDYRFAESTDEDNAGKLIIVVDDEEIVRETILAILSSLGFKAIAVPGGAEALALLENGDMPDLMMLDLTMPGLNGADVFKRIRNNGMEFPVLVVSGYTEEKLSSLFPDRKPEGFLQKPFSPESLKNKLNSTLIQR